MGKIDNRDKSGGETSYDNNSSIGLSWKGVSKKKLRKNPPYFSDPLLVPRINQYLAENKDKIYIDINDMVYDLQCRYKEYARRKRNVFRVSVQKAFTAVLQQCGINQVLTEGGNEYVGSTDNSSSGVEECGNEEERYKSSSNNQLMNLYTPKTQQAPSKNFNKSADQSTELIDLSSDEENVKKTDANEEQFANGVKNKKVQNYSAPKQTVLKIIQKTPSNPVKSDKVGTPSRKRKLMPNSGKINSLVVKEKRPVLQEPKVNFSDFGGNTKALEEVCKLILHIQHPEFYRRIGLTSPRGFLLHGPPGCGKSLLAAAIAGELDIHFLKVSAPELVGGVSGESEERIRELFDNAIYSAPCVLFIDEVDAITPNRQNAQREMERRIVAQILTCLDELNATPNGDQVLVIGATNRPDSLDPALRRAGRFDREVCLGIPDLKGREQILKVLCKNLKMCPNFSYEEVALNTPGFVGADLLSLTREAAIVAANRVFGALYRHREEKEAKRKKIKLDIKDPASSKKNGVNNCRNFSSSTNSDSSNFVNSNSPQGEIESASCNKPGSDTGEKEIINGETEECSEILNSISKSELDQEQFENSRRKTDDCEEMNEKESDAKQHKTKENECSAEKDGSDMDIAETVSEESVNCGDIEICKDDSVKTVGTDDESDIEVLPASFDYEPPNLETLLSWIRCTPALNFSELENLYLTQDDFTRALRCVQPSAKREGFATVPDVTWNDVGSLADIREELKMSILGPVKMKKQFEQLGLTAPSGILICGPPGCGKTLIAKAVANEAGINFISVKGPELLNMYVGESERAVRQCFQRARNSAPCVIFFDELDALCPKRSGSGENVATSRVVNQMLTEMDGVEDRKEVYLMAATNRPDIVDPAVLRPGRLDKVLYVGLPEEYDRIEILKALTKNGTRPKLASDVDLVDIAKSPECNGYSGADLAALIREAGIQALKDIIERHELTTDSEVEVSKEHFVRALKLIRPSVSPEDRKKYELLKQKYCSSISTGHSSSE